MHEIAYNTSQFLDVFYFFLFYKNNNKNTHTYHFRLIFGWYMTALIWHDGLIIKLLRFFFCYKKYDEGSIFYAFLSHFVMNMNIIVLGHVTCEPFNVTDWHKIWISLMYFLALCVWDLLSIFLWKFLLKRCLIDYPRKFSLISHLLLRAKCANKYNLP